MKRLALALGAWLIAAPCLALSPPALVVFQPVVANVGYWTGASPTTLLGASLKAWWDADDTTSGAVTTWTDRVGSVALTGTGTSAATSYNGLKRGVTFNGSTDCFTGTSLGTLPTGSTAGAIFASVSQDTPVGTTGLKIAVRYGGASGATVRGLGRNILGISGDNNFVYSDGATNTNDVSRVLYGPHVLDAAWASTTETGNFDGGAAVPAKATTASLSTSTTRIRIGAATAAGCGNFWGGVERQVMVTTALTDAQTSLLEGWLAWDGGTRAILAFSHPYRLRAP